ncbi:hypothetical protein [Acinetobacter bereziniae]|uniref:hypothetical protein n=1 Tax=Acinetobacter bereziniae TaxID=106648 RepID=UPI003AF8A169
MKKLIFLAVLLGLTGCGETDQNGISQSTLQSSPASFNYYKTATVRTMSAPVASFGQWVINGYASEGASTVLNANRIIGGVATESKALITPNVSQVSKILRAGLGGAALTFAVNELLDGIDWVMDPANNQVKYKETKLIGGNWWCNGGIGLTSRQACETHVTELLEIYSNVYTYATLTKCVYDSPIQTTCYFNTNRGEYYVIAGYINGSVNLEEKTLPLDVVSQKVIDNAQSGNTDAQAVTLAAAQAIVSEAENDATKAKEIEDEFERNADPKCSRHNAYMNGQASIIELRYNELKVDKLFLYRDYFKISTPHPSGYGSWEGHVQRYKFEQGVLKNLIVSAFLDGCPETIKAREWKDKPAPSKPDYAM